MFAFLLVVSSACSTTDRTSEENAWRLVENITDAVDLGNGRLLVSVEKPMTTSLRAMEFAALARSSGEALRMGGENFAIVKVDYDQRIGGQRRLDRRYNDPWIGTFEDLEKARELQAAGFGGITGATYVVRVLEDGEEPARDSFGAEATYEAMISELIGRYRI